MYFKNNLSPGECDKQGTVGGGGGGFCLVKEGSKQDWLTGHAYLREEYEIGADELPRQPDPHFMQIDPSIETVKGNNSKCHILEALESSFRKGNVVPGFLFSL